MDTRSELARREDKVADHEANVFAALLLMPPDLWDGFAKDVNWLDEKQVRALAHKFDVDLPLAFYREFVIDPLIRASVDRRRRSGRV